MSLQEELRTNLRESTIEPARRDHGSRTAPVGAKPPGAGGVGNGNGGRRVALGSDAMPPSGPNGKCGGRSNGGPRRPQGIALFDVPNFSTGEYWSNGGDAYAAVNSIDLRRLQRGLVALYGPLTCEYILAANRQKDRSNRFQWVRQCGWRFVEVARPQMIRKDPTDVYIIERISAATSQLNRQTIVLISHDGHFADVCRTYLKAGGHLVVAGFVDGVSHKLYELTSHPQCELLDLRHDLHAIAPLA